MPTARFEFDPELRPLLAAELRTGPVFVKFAGPQTAKHLIEALGIPHTEILSVSSDNLDVGLAHLVADGAVLSIRGIHSESLSAEPRFILDGHLGRLAAGLRMLGLDSTYERQPADADLAFRAQTERRVLLTRDRRLLMRKVVAHGYLIRSLEPDEQLMEVCLRFNLVEWFQPFLRCIRCNGLLESRDKAIVLDRLLPLTRRYYDEFRVCTSCSQPYWAGSHLVAMQAKVRRLTDILYAATST